MGLITSLLMVGGVVFYVNAPTVGAINLVQNSCGAGQDSTGKICAASKDNINAMVANLVNLLLYVLGVISVVVIIIGGIKFTTSDGDPGKIKSARETILYAVVGLVVAVLAWSIVNFVVTRFK